MKKFLVLTAALVLVAITVCLAEQKFLVIDDMESQISGAPEGSVDFGAGNGSSVTVTASTDTVQSGKQSMKVDYDSVDGGYMWIARGSGLDAKNSKWDVDGKTIDWEKYQAISFYMYGTDSKRDVAFDVKDNGGEILRFIVNDNFKGWKQIVCAFDQLYARDDWQPESAEKNGTIDFPLKSYQFEPKGAGKGTLYFDAVALIEK
ncbi:MAG: carbohydrate binding domain-containing protein [Candidatus Omnitrophota bacterium]